jgi:hypothetical protein
MQLLLHEIITLSESWAPHKTERTIYSMLLQQKIVPSTKQKRITKLKVKWRKLSISVVKVPQLHPYLKIIQYVFIYLGTNHYYHKCLKCTTHTLLLQVYECKYWKWWQNASRLLGFTKHTSFWQICFQLVSLHFCSVRISEGEINGHCMFSYLLNIKKMIRSCHTPTPCIWCEHLCKLW